jgi:hypothetical protein
MTTNYRRYDPRLKNLVAISGDIDRFKQYGIPASSLRQWVKDGPKDFFTLPEFEMDISSSVQEILTLKSQINALQAKHELVSRTIKIFGFQIQYKRLPSPESKTDILTAIKTAVQTLSLETCLEVIGLSSAAASSRSGSRRARLTSPSPSVNRRRWSVRTTSFIAERSFEGVSPVTSMSACRVARATLVSSSSSSLASAPN